jgi:steroid 5-alpha reductase family enzyme
MQALTELSFSNLCLGLLFASVSLVVAFTFLWIVQRLRGNAGIVDVGWTFALPACAVLYGSMLEGESTRKLLIITLSSIWGLRLGLYILFDRVLGKPEDGRYKMLRENWGKDFQFYIFVFFMFQALAAVFFSIPFLLIVTIPVTVAPLLTATDYLGIALWLIAFFGEAVSDNQLMRFRNNPSNRGKTCKIGLWHYSRHPNYFFQWLFWWSYFLLALHSPYWYLALPHPALMLYSLFKVTGIPYTEAQAVKSRGEDYIEYQRTTNAFFPWFPKH